MLALLKTKNTFNLPRKVYVSQDEPSRFVFVPKLFEAEKSFAVYWDLKKLSDEEVISYFQNIPDWDWKGQFSIGSTEDVHLGKLHTFFMTNQITNAAFEKTTQENHILFYQNPSRCFQYRLIKGYKFGELKPHHAEIILKYSEQKNLHTEEEIRENIESLPSVAIYKTSKDTVPVSGTAICRNGFISGIFVVPSSRNNGFCTVMVSELSRKLNDFNLPMIMIISHKNAASIHAALKINFEAIGTINYIKYS